MAHASHDELTSKPKPRRTLFGLDPLTLLLHPNAGQVSQDIADDPMLEELAALLVVTRTAVPLAPIAASMEDEASSETACALPERQQILVQHALLYNA
jgi:hypothetical protein